MTQRRAAALRRMHSINLCTCTLAMVTHARLSGSDALNRTRMCVVDLLTENTALIRHIAAEADAKFPAAAPGSCAQATTWAPTETSCFLLWNCRSMRNKPREFEELLDTPEKRPAIIALTETHLRTIDLKSTWLRHMLPGYAIYASCHPHSTMVRWTRRGCGLMNDGRHAPCTIPSTCPSAFAHKNRDNRRDTIAKHHLTV